MQLRDGVEGHGPEREVRAARPDGSNSGSGMGISRRVPSHLTLHRSLQQVALRSDRRGFPVPPLPHGAAPDEFVRHDSRYAMLTRRPKNRVHAGT